MSVVVRVGAESRRFDNTVFENNMDEFEPFADNSRVSKNFSNLLWRRVGGYVEVFGRFAEQIVANSAPYDIRFKSEFSQSINDF